MEKMQSTGKLVREATVARAVTYGPFHRRSRTHGFPAGDSFPTLYVCQTQILSSLTSPIGTYTADRSCIAPLQAWTNVLTTRNSAVTPWWTPVELRGREPIVSSLARNAR